VLHRAVALERARLHVTTAQVPVPDRVSRDFHALDIGRTAAVHVNALAWRGSPPNPEEDALESCFA